MKKQKEINKFIEQTERMYSFYPTGCGESFGEILCYEIHTEPINPGMDWKTLTDGYNTGLTFRELAAK